MLPDSGEKVDTESVNNPDIEYLMRRYGDQVLRLAYLYLHDVEEAKDTAQEVFLKIFASLNKFQGKSSAYTWIYRITVNLCRDKLRKKYRLNWLPLKSEWEFSSGLNTEEQALKNLEKNFLFKAVMMLPATFREVIVLYYLYQLDVRKIAEVTGTNPALVKIRLYRGRQKLKKILTEKGVGVDE